MCGDCFVCIYLVCQCDGLELGRRNRRITVRGVAVRINNNKTRLKHFIQQWLKDYFLPREEGQIYIQELHFYVQEYNNQMKKIGKSLLD